MSLRVGRLQRLLPKSELGRSVMLLAGGTATGQALVMASYPLLTRLYAPEDFGVLAVYTSILVVVMVFATLRYDAGIPVPKDEDDAAHLAALSLVVVVGVSVLCALGVWLFGHDLVAWSNTPALAPYLGLLPVSLFGAGVFITFNSWAVRKQAIAGLAKTKLRQGIGQAITQVGLGCLHLGPIGLLAGDLVGRAAGCHTLASQAWKADSDRFQRIRLSRLWAIALRYRQFPLLTCPSALINSLSTQLPFLMLAVLYDPRVVGLYALGHRALAIPMGLIGNAVQQVFLGELARLSRQQPDAMNAFFWRTIVRLLLMGAGPVALLALAGPWLFAWAFGEGWREAGSYVQLLAPMFLLQFVAAPVGGTLSILERQPLNLFREVARLVVMAGALGYAYVAHSSPVETVLLVSAAGTAGYLLYLYISWYAVADAAKSPSAMLKEDAP